ncbi:MAG: TIGR00341 family protein [Acidobacteria bacterium]|nr:TIGR00341 family protein [Acidobacteriota bacterium]
MTGEPMTQGPVSQRNIDRWLRLRESSKPDIYRQVAATARIDDVPYWLQILFSSVIATLGLVLNSPAVIIGAMLISPLMGPIMATGLAMALGDMRLALRAIATLIASIIAAVAFSATLVWLLPFHSSTPEILARTNPTLLDLAIAIASGLAGSVATVRIGSSEGGETALPGVAIAVALMPPLCTVGFGVGNEWNMPTMIGAGLLFLTNLVAIIASAFLVFLLSGMKTTQVAAAMEEAQTQRRESSASPIDHLLQHRIFAAGGVASKLHWRVVILLALLGLIAVPLRRSLTQVVTETRDRAAIQDGLKQLATPQDLVSQKVELGTHQISVELITTKQVTQEAVHAASEWIKARTGKDVQLHVTEVASRSEVNDLMRKIANAPVLETPAAQQPKLSALAEQTRAIVQQKLAETWPLQTVPLEGFALALEGDAPVLTVRYVSVRTLPAETMAVLQETMRKALESPALRLEGKRIPPPRKR